MTRAFTLGLVLLPLMAAGGLAQSAPQARDEGTDANAAQYCAGIANAAADARFARQASALAAMEKEIEERIAKLEAKRAEYQQWLQRRETFLKKADESLVAVITQMRPDAAAAQLTAMSEDAASAILTRLSARTASAILNEMDPTRAAQLATIIAGMSRRNPNEGKPG
ncbi:MotE family protein [Aquabacter spiritensis]|uniref:Flagellar motility protein MotE (MotC chaperone) n=1 Tax=Aquabacter spiritensis TaxID=933073 RepID=A0A4V2UYM0_9HYPH|nr:MotE family protein [Aquabacter spiritensis]TCT07928.1 flagellar motility protein MotE (MotC chaperone) [Aquabacter spiritensis]